MNYIHFNKFNNNENFQNQIEGKNIDIEKILDNTKLAKHKDKLQNFMNENENQIINEGRKQKFVNNYPNVINKIRTKLLKPPYYIP